MASDKSSMIGSFIEAAPPGELTDVVNDIKALTIDEPHSLDAQEDSFRKYHEEQFTTARIPNGSSEVIITPFNSLQGGRYYDVDNQSSFAFDHTASKVSDVQSHSLDSKHADLVKSILKSYKTHAAEHFPSAVVGVYPTENESKIALVLVANKYSPNNFWNGRWRSRYILDPSSGSLSGTVKVDVHYYEDGNVRLLTDKSLSGSSSAGNGGDAVRQIASLEKKYQEDLNRAFGNLSEGVFKTLRRQLPVTRQKIEWEKVSGYRLGQDIGGGRSR